MILPQIEHFDSVNPWDKSTFDRCFNLPLTGLWKEAIPPLVQSVTAFQVVNDDKGTASSLVLLSRCLKKLSVQDYGELQGQFLDMFPTAHPYYEAYQKALKAVRLIEDLGATVYVANSQVGYMQPLQLKQQQ